MQYVVEPDVVCQGNSHVVSAWVESARDQRLLLTEPKSEVLLQLTRVFNVVPKSDGLILLRHSEKHRSLEAGMHLRDCARVEAVAHLLEVDR